MTLTKIMVKLMMMMMMMLIIIVITVKTGKTEKRNYEKD